MAFPTPNNDEAFNPDPDIYPGIADALFIGNFHKTLPHNEYGEVIPSAYREFERTCLETEAGSPINFEEVPAGNLIPPFNATADPKVNKAPAKLTSPLAGAARENHGPDPKSLEMLPPPGIRSDSTAAEMVELYWMALLRDVPLADFSSHPNVMLAKNEVSWAYAKALEKDGSVGRIQLGLDLPRENGTLDIQLETLFRSGLHDEEHGPLVSQFFIRDIPYGVQTIDQRQIPYLMNKDFLTNYDDWLRAQNTGKDKWGRDYPNCNNYADEARGESYYVGAKRYISTMRDLARFVNRDALHQAYFNAALFLDAIGAPLDDGNPYKGARYSREGAFASLGGPDLLTLVSEVASRALKVVWRQKWQVHRRARPEAYGGLLQMQCKGYKGCTRNYHLPSWIAETTACEKILSYNQSLNGGEETYFLPMAFSAGSPTHPAYGAGHATVAGACVTVLKAWFDEDHKLGELIQRVQATGNSKEPGAIKGLLKPGSHLSGENFNEPEPYTDGGAGQMTVGGELNKLASNVAMGRSMGGVHWRSDNTRSLRLGEEIAIEILRKRTLEYAERPVSFTFRSFDRYRVFISQGQVSKAW